MVTSKSVCPTTVPDGGSGPSEAWGQVVWSSCTPIQLRWIRTLIITIRTISAMIAASNEGRGEASKSTSSTAIFVCEGYCLSCVCVLFVVVVVFLILGKPTALSMCSMLITWMFYLLSKLNSWWAFYSHLISDKRCSKTPCQGHADLVLCLYKLLT